MKLKDTCSLEEKLWQTWAAYLKVETLLYQQSPSSQTMVFPVVMYGCESWTMKKAEGRRIDAFELWCWRRLLSPLNYKEIQPVHPKGNQPWIFIGRTDTEAPILWPPDGKNWLLAKDPDAGKDWRREEKGTTKDEMTGWHHWLNGPEFEQALGDGQGQGSLACCSLWGGRVGHDWETEQQHTQLTTEHLV